MTETEIGLLKQVSVFTDTSIMDRDFNWYHDAAFNVV